VPTIVFHGDRDHGMATKVREMLRFGVQAKNDLALRVRNCDKAMNLGDRGALESPIQSLDPMHTAARTRANLLLRQPRLPITVRPTKADIAIAREIARGTGPAPEEVARALTWGADEKVLLVLAAAGWLASHGRGERLRRVGNHALLVAVAASLLPHGMKLLFDQTRPDRRTVLGHIHGISFSGKREDAFPSGHALHMGALASAAGSLPAGPRRAIRALAVGFSLTRIVVLAHWASDVITGFAPRSHP
jgi:membrane-associated phospholipid phosphatase